MIKVTGASGFIGQAVVKYCNAHAIPVTGYSRSQDAQIRNLTYISDYKLIPENGILLHLGEHNHISSITPEIISEQIKVSEALSKKKFNKIVYASSAAVYNSSTNAIPPTSLDFSVSVYAMNKRKNEEYYLQSSNVVARMSNVYGQFMSKQNVFSEILKQKSNSIIKVQNINSIRDYIWVDDVAEALVKLGLSDLKGIFHVSTGESTSVSELIKLICSIAGNSNYIYEQTSPGPLSQLVLDAESTKISLDWKPVTSLTMGLNNLIRKV